jgi:deoxycytidylate deaminase
MHRVLNWIKLVRSAFAPQQMNGDLDEIGSVATHSVFFFVEQPIWIMLSSPPESAPQLLLNLDVRRQYTELVIGLVGAVGSQMGSVEEALLSAFKPLNYQCEQVKLIELLHEVEKWKDLQHDHEDERIRTHMDAGDEFRRLIGGNDALAVLGVGKIRSLRNKITSDPDKPRPRCVYLLRSLKHHEEVECLREIYGRAFILVAAYSPREERVQHLANKIAESRYGATAEQCRPDAERLVNRDQEDSAAPHGQNVRAAFPMADVFIATTSKLAMEGQIRRFLELLFGKVSHTPTRDEYCMFHAQAAAMRSAALGRQVGAAIATGEGDVVAVGTNEVPKAGGGQYWEGDVPDARDFMLGRDSSDRLKWSNLGELLEKFSKAGGWLADDKVALSPEERVRTALPVVKGARLMQPLEFGRAVHAEMAAIVDSAKRGVAVRNCTLYTTTFPCHECARHIIASGVRRVVFIEPYAKSLAAHLHEDAISVDSAIEIEGMVSFDPFVGVAPRRYNELFTMLEDRKTADGSVVLWNPAHALPRLSESPWVYVRSEKEALALLFDAMKREKLSPV